MKKDVTLLAKGGICRIVIDYLENSQEYRICQICDDFNFGADSLHDGIACECSISHYVTECEPGSLFFNCIGNYKFMKSRFEYSSMLRAKGCLSFNIIHENAYVSNNAKLGNGLLIMPNVVVQTFAKIGDDTVIFSGSIIEHDCIVGKNVYISPSVTLCGKVQIEDNVYLGPGAVIAAGVHVGENSVIGAGAVVLKDVESGSVVYGQPAERIRHNNLW